jgi:hypothetical protein
MASWNLEAVVVLGLTAVVLLPRKITRVWPAPAETG